MHANLTIQFLKLICVAIVAAQMSACATSQAKKSEESVNDLFASYSIAEIVEAGDEAFRQREYNRAVFIYMQALQIEESADNLYRVGLAKIKVNDNGFAWNVFRRALELEPDHVSTHEEIGILYVGMGQPVQAARHLEKVVQLDPKRWRAYNALGVIADVEKRFSDAVDHYKKALEYYPDSAMLMNNIGYSYYLSGDLQEATNWLDAAVQAQPGYELAIRNLALLYARQGWYKEAVDSFLKIESRPEVYNDVGYIAMQNGDYYEAKRLLTDAIRLSPVYYETANINMAALKEAMASQDAHTERETLADNITEVGFAENQGSKSLSVMPQALNVRSFPDSDAEIIDYLKTGDAVQVITSRDTWAFISYRPEDVETDLTGWVRERYLSSTTDSTLALPEPEISLEGIDTSTLDIKPKILEASGQSADENKALLAD